MTLAEVTASFLDQARQNPPIVKSQLPARIHQQAVQLLTDYFGANAPLSDLTSARIRDFLARWYVEKAHTSKTNNSQTAIDQILTTQELLTSVGEFLRWTDQQNGNDLAERCASPLTELGETLPRALAITELLSTWLRQRRGAFTFPEFLTSFEEGGQGQYDLDTPGEVGAIEGYFRVIRVEGLLIEAEEMISEERVWPIIFPDNVAAMLDRAYVFNLELVQTGAAWQIADCGFVYPPGTEV